MFQQLKLHSEIVFDLRHILRLRLTEWDSLSLTRVALAFSIVFASGSLALPAAAQRSNSSPRIDRPNIVLINLDDADCDMFSPAILDSYLPTIGEIARGGLSFTNCHVTTPLCGPSRVCLLRGQYAHRTGIKTNRAEGPMNNGFTGAYPLFRAKGLANDHLGSWMRAAGYRTMLIGKYAHGQVIPEFVEGWDDMHISYGGKYFASVRYSTRYPVGQRRVPPDEGAYRTNQESDEILWFLDQYAKNADAESRPPFFMYYAPLAPHQPAAGGEMLPTELRELAQDLQVPATADFNEADVSDKPLHLQTGLLTDPQIQSIHEEHRERVVSLIPVDRLVRKLLDKLDEIGVLDHTHVILTSDHGYQLGHNRMIAKKMPYHRNTHVPMYWIGPGLKAGSVSEQLVSHIDFAPTFLEMATQKPEATKSNVKFDGVSLLPILTGQIRKQPLRESLLIENWEEKGQLGQYIPGTYSTHRTFSTVYTEWANGAREFYDLASDPFQINNRYSELSGTIQTRLADELRSLKNDMEKPVATIASAGLISRTPVLKGFAEDANGVDRVKVQIRREDESFFDGANWQSKPFDLDAELLNPGGLISEWRLGVELTKLSTGSKINVITSAKNIHGKLSSDVSSQLEVDANAPETNLKLPEQDSTVRSPVMLFGFANDDHEIRGIEFQLQRKKDGKYFDGNAWREDPIVFIKRLRGHERWHTNVDLGVGEYVVTAAAFDEAGNLDPSPSEKRFVVED